MRCYANIDLLELEKNINKLDIEKNKIMAVIKANAYGHGSKEIFKKLISLGISNFCVATLDEALELNEIDSEKDILILGPIEYGNYKYIENKNILVTISSFEEINYLIKHNLKNRIHLKLDTGMTRIGFSIKDKIKIEEILKQNKLNIEGIFSHLSSVNNDDSYTLLQLEKFSSFTENMNIKKHVLSSSGYLKYKDSKYVYDYVRIGISLYDNVMSLYSRVCSIRKLEEDTYIGYEKTVKINKGEYIGVISIGYADGLKRCLSNKGYVVINEKKYKIVGNICMDMAMILIDETVNIGDEVEIFGKNLSIFEISNLSSTIHYEILTSISHRVKRIYKGEL